MTGRAPSLTWRLFAGIGLPVAALILLTAVLSYAGADDEINEVYDSQLAISAQSLLRAAESQAPSASSLSAPPAQVDEHEQKDIDEYARRHSFRVWRGDRLVLSSPNAPRDAVHAHGYGFATAGDDTWRVYTLIQGSYVVETRENIEARSEEVDKILFGLILPLVLLLPVIAAVLWFGIRLGLRGLHGFAGAIGRRSPDDLSRIDIAVPGEMTPVVEAVNGLLGKLEASLDQERAFTDNAAHELRTPLAVIKAQAEVIEGARSGAERTAAIAELGLGVGRATRLLEQLLTLARLRHLPPHHIDTSLMDQARDAIKDVYPIAAQKGLDLRLQGDETARARTDPALLHLILRNLLENAAKYAPADTAVDIAVTPGEIVLRDRGPGIPEVERAKVFARFYRVQGTREPGSGLGLSIVRTAAQQLGCDVDLFTPADGRGLGVRIAFPS